MRPRGTGKPTNTSHRLSRRQDRPCANIHDSQALDAKDTAVGIDNGVEAAFLPITPIQFVTNQLLGVVSSPQESKNRTEHGGTNLQVQLA